MKKLLISIFVILCAAGGYAQEAQEYTTQIDTAAEKGKRKTATMSEAEQCIYEAGTMLRKSGRLRGCAVAVPVITGVAGGALIGDALYKQKKNNNTNTKAEFYGGIAVAGVGLVFGLILEARSNHYTKKAGKRLQQFKFTGSSLTYNF